MRKSSNRRRGLASALGLSLLAMLALGAFGAGAAQAAPQWHVEGAVFTGSEEVAWATAGTAVLKNANGIEVSCNEITGSSTITGGNSDYGTITLNKCSLVGLPECKVEPVKFPITGSLVSSGNYGYEKLSTSSVLKITACAWATSYELFGSIGAKIGEEEAVQSGRYFSEASDKAAGATGLGSWRLTAHANARLIGARMGMKFGLGGGVWSPYEPASWTVGGTVFSGEETIQVSKTGLATLTNDAGEQMICTMSGSGLRIYGSSKSAGTITFQKCIMTVGTCLLPKTISVSAAGYIGRDEYVTVRERAELSGSISGFSGECPFKTGTVTGSIAATLKSTGSALKKKFEAKAEEVTGAFGLRIDGERWRVAAEIEETPSGANAGKALGVI